MLCYPMIAITNNIKCFFNLVHFSLDKCFKGCYLIIKIEID